VLLPLAKFTAFHWIGIAFACWAVIVSTLGARNPDFPRNGGAQRVVVAISALLVAATLGAAIATSEKHGKHHSSHGDRENPTKPGETPENAPNE
jgi:membrane protein DedA with SNARE-associated domain